MLKCQNWTNNSYEYFKQGSLRYHMKEHPINKNCIDFIIKNKISKLELINLEGQAKAFAEIESGTDFSNFKYNIQIDNNIPIELQEEGFIHEITHIHYLNIINIQEYEEESIEKHARNFYENNLNFCKNRYKEAISIFTSPTLF